MIAATVWLVIFTVLMGIEFIMTNSKAIWLAIGALAALLISWFGAPVWLQIMIFILLSGLDFHFLRPAVLNFVNAKLKPQADQTLVGRTAVVTARICNKDREGAISIDGMIMEARTVSNSDILEIGTEVTVVRAYTDRLIVTPPVYETEDIEEDF